jgi:hypothetical protein
MRRVLALLLAGAPRLAAAHGGNPAQAVLLEPAELGPTVDQSYLIEWIDAGPPPPPTGSAMVNVFYTTEIPYTYPLGIIPPTLTGTAIATGILEELEPSELTWEVSNVPSGHYWIWTRVDDPPVEMSPQYIRYSPAPLTVLHAGDEIGPAIALLDPSSEFSTADDFYTIDYSSWDSTGTARIRFEASPDAFRSEPNWFVIADNVSAQPRGVIGWNTSSLAEGDYMLRATITDCEGRTFVAHSRYFLFVAHIDPVDAGVPDGPQPDGGALEEWCSQLPDDSGVTPADAGLADGGSTPPPDAGMPEPPTTDEGCGCTSAGEGRGSIAACLALLLLRRRSRGKL